MVELYFFFSTGVNLKTPNALKHAHLTLVLWCQLYIKKISHSHYFVNYAVIGEPRSPTAEATTLFATQLNCIDCVLTCLT
jgi:hypothetical protein